jgi:hypothetical protein
VTVAAVIADRPGQPERHDRRRTGRQASPAAIETAASPPVDMNVRKPMPRPAPYRNAVTDGGKNVRHQSGTCRRSCGTATSARGSVPIA